MRSFIADRMMRRAVTRPDRRRFPPPVDGAASAPTVVRRAPSFMNDGLLDLEQWTQMLREVGFGSSPRFLIASVSMV